MHRTAILSSLGALFSSHAFAAPATDVSPRQDCEFDSANNPSCWGAYSLSTNWYDEAPDTGVVREFWWEITETTLAPDGFARPVQTINGSIPGPQITADWGDTIIVHVKNSAANNGSSIHWHGIRQQGSNHFDGVSGITQCPTAPGDSMTYTWKATQYGTTWYHSHFSLQAWNGVFGGVVINGPASAPYDEDKGTLLFSDWYHETVDALYPQAQTAGPPAAQNGLINGTNTWTDGGGSKFQTSVTAGTRTRLRLVNTALDTHFRFSIDNHTLTVISADLVPIQPYTADTISVGIGQRYDVIVEANQNAGNYWLRAIPQTSCSSTNENTLDITGIFNYDSVDVATPTTTGWAYSDSCDDETDNLKPFVELDAAQGGLEADFEVGLAVNGVFRWTINDQQFYTHWEYPTLEQIIDNNSTWAPEQQINIYNDTNEWVYFVIESQIGLTHPIHLHGHDFYVLGQQAAATYTSTDQLNFSNPPRRDVAMLPASGYLVLGFPTDNPGVWLMHCHIGWHTVEGLALQLVERESEIAAFVDADILQEGCSNWVDYATDAEKVQDDTGI
ncbi:putative Multicopper oxidase [Seiridium unicorne]|uniref:Multicopper oxidase n=1 Tax=Seiridium unicorne TaxID=138068 RepID=A0ABR2UPT7_9PEZI